MPDYLERAQDYMCWVQRAADELEETRKAQKLSPMGKIPHGVEMANTYALLSIAESLAEIRRTAFHLMK